MQAGYSKKQSTALDWSGARNWEKLRLFGAHEKLDMVKVALRSAEPDQESLPNRIIDWVLP